MLRAYCYTKGTPYIYMMQGVSKQQIMGWASVDKEKIDSRPNTTVMNAKLSQQKYRP